MGVTRGNAAALHYNEEIRRCDLRRPAQCGEVERRVAALPVRVEIELASSSVVDDSIAQIVAGCCPRCTVKTVRGEGTRGKAGEDVLVELDQIYVNIEIDDPIEIRIQRRGEVELVSTSTSGE